MGDAGREPQVTDAKVNQRGAQAIVCDECKGSRIQSVFVLFLIFPLLERSFYVI